MTGTFSSILITSVLVSGAPVGALDASAQDLTSRRFHFEYTTTVDVPDGAREVSIWLPVPQTDENQTIDNLTVTTSPETPYRIETEPTYGNRYLYLKSSRSAGTVPDEITVTLAFDVTRHETQVLRSTAMDDQDELLGPDALAPITDEVKKRAREATTGRANASEMARGIYDRVLADMTYDKSGDGWGRGDIYYACDAGAGNCSDFHTLFIGMMRASEVPSYFEIGFPLPADQTEGEIGGYHCWAWFEAGNVWRPVDVSEADKAPDRADYFFGTICCNRVAFTRGRDLKLSPSPVSGPVNFFIYPIVEVDGETPSEGVSRKFTFRDLEG